MNSTNTPRTDWFADLMEYLKPQLGEETVKDCLTYWQANEPEIVLDGLIESFEWKKPELPPELLQTLMEYLKWFDKATEGRTNYAERLKKLYA